jgi:siderophore synthetase component
VTTTSGHRAAESAEDELLLRVLSALLREDTVGLRTRSTPLRRTDGLWLRLPVTPAPTGGALLLPVADDGFQCEYAARLPLLESEPDGALLTGLDRVIGALGALADPQDRGGFVAFAAECRQTLATMRLQADAAGPVRERLAATYGADPAEWTGWAASLAFDTLAAYRDHPVYPTARGRVALGEDQLRGYAPEFHPAFELRWAAVPRADVTPPVPGVSDGWPAPGDLGLPHLDDSHLTLPVHPLTFRYLPEQAVRAEASRIGVVPTLSMRTVALADDPAVHLKLPLPTATLGLRNRRTVKAGTFEDGATTERLLRTVLDREPRFRGRILLADEQQHLHAGHELLAVLRRRYPPGLDGAVIVPLAALLAEGPGGRRVVDRLADRFFGGDVPALFDAFLTLLIDWQTTLFTYGIALESHQQNISLILDQVSGRPRARLLLKDNDGPRINPHRLKDAIGFVPGFTDRRTFTDGDKPLADLFTTITVHLCAAAFAFGLPEHRDRILGLVRDRLDAMAGPRLRAHVLDAARLPVKAMVTAGTLLSKERSGAADINKHYTTGPNYLRRPDGGRP